ncbi:hypothetical protein [Eleftheria terrae]|uniref:hypothetical protein n=1 Tax=Eleftheria terrae TaxID=1597781 RepID=UPI00263B367D|nr:hypothetical protein [Eleftheria terrae]WKB53030.1 hypothetical protein N7L95_01085 [Eleftheria terrae]
MAEVTTTIATGVAAAASTTAVAAGRPPEEVILWAFLGSLVAVWLDGRRDEPLSFRWGFNVLGLVLVSVLSGIVGSAVLLSLAPEFSLTAPLAKIERWGLAFVIAALIHRVGPLAFGVLRGRITKVGGSDAANP